MVTVGRDAVYISWTLATDTEIDRFELTRSIANANDGVDGPDDSDQQVQDHEQTSVFIGATAGFEYVDANVEAGTEYCYGVEAVDQNGQHSSLTMPACIVTPGERLDKLKSSTPSPVFNPPADFSRTS